MIGRNLRLVVCLLAYSAHVSNCSEVILTLESDSSSGTWGPWDSCPDNSFAIGARTKYYTRSASYWERSLGYSSYSRSSQTTASRNIFVGIELSCGTVPDFRSHGSIHSSVGAQGEWRKPVAYCTSGNYVLGLSAVDPNYHTVSPIMGIRCLCSNQTIDLDLEPSQADYAAQMFIQPPKICPDSYAICGIRTLLVASYTSGSAKSAINSLQFHCCKVPLAKESSLNPSLILAEIIGLHKNHTEMLVKGYEKQGDALQKKYENQGDSLQKNYEDQVDSLQKSFEKHGNTLQGNYNNHGSILQKNYEKHFDLMFHQVKAQKAHLSQLHAIQRQAFEKTMEDHRNQSSYILKSYRDLLADQRVIRSRDQPLLLHTEKQEKSLKVGAKSWALNFAVLVLICLVLAVIVGAVFVYWRKSFPTAQTYLRLRRLVK